MPHVGDIKALQENERAIATLARIIWAFANCVPKISYIRLHEQLEALCKKDKAFASTAYQNLRNFAIRETSVPLEGRALLGLYAVSADIITNEQAQRDKRAVREALNECQIVKIYRHYVGHEVLDPFMIEEFESQMRTGKASDLGSQLRYYFGASEDGISRSIATFLATTGEEKGRGYFECFRYATRPGHLVKSFLYVFEPVPSLPLCGFRHFYRDDLNHSREGLGGIFPLALGTYFLGTIGSGMALKVIALPPPGAVTNYDEFDGLLLSVEPNNMLAASRILIARTNHRHSDQAKPSIIDEKKLHEHVSGIIGVGKKAADRKELASKIRSRIKNTIDSSYADLIDAKGKLADDDRMRTLVGDALGVFGQHPLLRRVENKKAFNPSRSDDIAFNSALRPYST